ncbi:putative DNA-binding transcriptional regulator AlpA [Bradyrhizobium sp. AZCC 1610]|uniref:helix-turn-helix transcriptional regulator n=1 Tax=Bradyrhizobium sp. AZCC 1610 TaxID=3117020 RepID=UPI002FF04CB6
MTTAMNDNPDNGIRQMISISEVLKRVPVSRSTLHRMVKEKRFPQSHELSPMRVGFFLDEVIEWQKKLTDKAA